MEETWGGFFRMASLAQRSKVFGLFLCGLMTIAVSTASIRWVWQTHLGPEVEPARSIPTPIPPVAPYVFPYEIKQVSMAISNEGGTRTAYAQFTLMLDCPNEDSQKLMVLNRAKLLDSIFEVGSTMTIEQFQGVKAPEAFAFFKKRLLEIYKGQFGDLAPREVVFRDWFIN